MTILLYLKFVRVKFSSKPSPPPCLVLIWNFVFFKNINQALEILLRVELPRKGSELVIVSHTTLLPSKSTCVIPLPLPLHHKETIGDERSPTFPGNVTP